MNIFPQLYTNRLILRKIQVEDVSALVKYANNKNISDYILNMPYPYQEPDAVFRISYVHRGFIANTRWIFAITLKETGEFIGEISLHLDDKKTMAELGYWIGEPFWNRGLITEAIPAILRFGFEKLGVDLIFATCKEENIGSNRVLQKNGLKQNGLAGSVLQYILRKDNFDAAG